MKLLSKISFAFLFVFSVTVAHSQSSVSGKVADGNGVPISGATVIVDGTTTGTVTDMDGAYSISVMSESTVTLTASYLGFKTQSQSVTLSGMSATVNFTLAEDFSTLDGYVPYVVGWKDLKNEEFNERFMEFLKVYPVLQSGCFFNSFKLMYEMRDLGVEQVHGWYGFDVGGCVEYDTWVNRYLDGKRGKEYVYDSTRKDDVTSHWPGYDSVWDYDRGLVWKRHAWNKLNGVHFDSTRETMSNPGWVYYNEMYSQDMMDLMLSDLDTKKLPNLLKQLQYSVQSVSNFYDETLCVKGKHDSRLKLEELEYKFS